MKTSYSPLNRGLFLCVALTTISRSLAVEPSPLELSLVDFEDPRAIRLSSNQAESQIVKVAGGAALEIATMADAQYPSVRVEPVAGKWDLSGYEAVTAEVRNPEDAPLRVLLAVNNPGADGRNRCSTASLALGPRETGTLTVSFGKWHGEARPFDSSNVVSFDILLDRPGRAHRFTVDNVRAVRSERFDLRRAMADPFFQTLALPEGRSIHLGRGINLGNALEAPREGEWGVTLEEEYFRAIAAAGFDSIRLPVRWSAHAAPTAPYTIEPEFFARVDWAVEQAFSRGLAVVLNVHHYSEMDERPDEHLPRLLALWQQIAEHYRELPPTLAFELLNEPHDKLTAAKWNGILKDVLTVVRRTNPTRTVVVGPVAWNGIGELKSLELPEADRHLLVTVHYYGPFAFTHQGAHWIDAKSRPPIGTRWSGTEAEREAVTRDFDTAALWGLKHRRPIYLGEFGALGKADLESRARWTKFIAEEAASRRMGFAYWEFCSGFGAYDSARHAWIEPLREALVPTTKK
ncbi:MAG: glycoside hydrolase family 5 protein [Planctomycetia bacterium]|nr:glycoside hydrolase family 5 protein [Planctomycetia bacterium]